ncbi:MAG: hypothetical protein GX567_11480 [Clostridia bacterium]|nr:hypothetical protein [Clostridia bacterium]
MTVGAETESRMLSDKVKNIRRCLAAVIVSIYSLVLVLILLDLFLCDKHADYICKREVLISNIGILLIILVTVTIMYVVSTKTKLLKHTRLLYRRLSINRDFYKILILSSLLLLLIQIYVAYDILFFAGWDCDMVVSMAFERAFHGTIESSDYLSLNPNNVALTYALSMVIRFFSFMKNYTAIYFALTCVEIILTDISLFLLALTVKRITLRKSIGLCAWVVGVLLIGMSPWMIVPYSDGYCLIIPITILYLYTIRKECKYQSLCFFGMVFMGMLGYVFKPYTVIVLIAILLVEGFHVIFEKPKWKHVFLNLSAMTLAFILAMGIKVYMTQHIGCELDAEKAYSYSHYCMMGLNEKWDGIWNNDDAAFSQSFENKEERTQANLLAIRTRLEAFGLGGYLEFLKNKTLVNFNDGAFAWGFEGGEGGFFMIKLKEPTDTADFLRSFFYNDEAGTRNRYLVLMQQTVWIFVLVTMPGIAFKLYSRRRSKELVLMLSVLGMIFFVTIFEARARYLYDFVLVFIAASACGTDHIIQIIHRRLRHVHTKRKRKTGDLCQ